MARHLELEDLYSLPVIEGARLSPAGDRVAYVVRLADRLHDNYEFRIWTVDVETLKREPLTTGRHSRNPVWSPTGDRISFLSTSSDVAYYQLWSMAPNGEAAKPLTDPGMSVRSHVWAPQGDQVAFLGTAMSTKPGVNSSTGESEADHYESSGEQLFVVDLETRRVRQLTSDLIDIDTPAWSPDGTAIAVTAETGDETDAGRRLLVHRMEDGETSELLRSWTMIDRPIWLSNSRDLIFTGFEHPLVQNCRLWRIEIGTPDPTPIAANFDRNVMIGEPGYPGGTPIIGLDNESLIFCARDQGATGMFRVDLTTDSVTPIVNTPDRVISEPSRDASGELVAFIGASAHTCGEVHLMRWDGSDERTLTDHVATAWPNVALSQSRRCAFESSDGTPIHGWLLGTQGPSAPLLLDIHGGPHGAWNPTLHPAHLYHHLLVAAGWQVLLLNPRGSDGYGESFLRGAIGGWGRSDMPDLVGPVQELIEAGETDPMQVSVTGYSYGGYMTNWIAAHSDLFASAVTGAGVANLLSLIASSDVGMQIRDEELACRPEEIDRVARDLSPLTHSESVTSPFLILHGGEDRSCPLGQAEEWFDALSKGMTPVELVVYPGEGHALLLNGQPSHRLDYSARLVDWVNSHRKDSN